MSVSLYRTLITDPRHYAPGATGVVGNGLADATITTFLELAASVHSASAWGSVFPTAMVYYAAHMIERSPGLLVGNQGATEVGSLQMQKDADLQRTYGPLLGMQTASIVDADLATTNYGLTYIRLRNTRAAVRAPFARGAV